MSVFMEKYCTIYTSFVGSVIPSNQSVLTIVFKHGQLEYTSSLICAFGVAIQVLAWLAAVDLYEKFAIPKTDSNHDASILATPAYTPYNKLMYVKWKNNNNHSTNKLHESKMVR